MGDPTTNVSPTRLGLYLYAGSLVVVVSAIVYALTVRGAGFGSPLAVLALALLGAVAERGRVRLTRNLELSISLVPTLFAAVVFGPAAAMVVAAASLLGDLLPRKGVAPAYSRWAIYTLSSAVTGAATGAVASAAAALVASPLGGVVAATTAGAVTAQALDTMFCSVTLRLRRTGRLLEVVRTLAPVMAVSIPIYAPVVALLAYTYTRVSPWALPLFLAPALAAQRLFGLYQEQRRLAEDVSATNERLERANISFATALVATLEARDRYTAGHSAAVATYARDIARRMNLGDDAQQLAHLCGLVHDIGKIGLPAGLLEKPGALTLEERRMMEKHSEIGERILSKVEDYSEIARIVRHHHERLDGHGYPDKLVREDIPLISRIIAVADAYDAMTSDRPYRAAMPSRVARLRLAQAVESQFDTSVVAAFEAILASAHEDYRRGRNGTAAPLGSNASSVAVAS